MIWLDLTKGQLGLKAEEIVLVFNTTLLKNGFQGKANNLNRYLATSIKHLTKPAFFFTAANLTSRENLLNPLKITV